MRPPPHLRFLVPLVVVRHDAHLLVHELVRVAGAGVEDLEVAVGVLGARAVARVAAKDVPDVAGERGRGDEEAEDGPVAHAVHGGIGAGEEEGGRDAAAIGDGDHAARREGRGRRALDRRGAVLHFPRNKGEDGGVGAGNDHDGKVAHAPVLHDGQQQVARGDEDEAGDDVARALPGPVAVQAVADDDEHGEDVGRDGQQLGVVALEAERGDDGGREVAKGVERVGHEEVHGGEEPEVGVGDRLARHLAVPVLVLHRGRKGAEALDGEGPLLGRQPGGRLRVVGQHEPDHDADDDGGDSFLRTNQDEEPLPTGEAALAVEEGDARGEEAAKGAGDGDGGGKDGHAGGALLGLVPEAEVHHDAREEAGLGEAEHDADGEEAAVGGDGGGADGDDAPRDHDAGDPLGGGEVLEHDVGRELHEDVGDEEEGDGDVVALAREVEHGDDVVLGRVVVERAGVAEVDAVEVGHADPGEDSEVLLADDAALHLLIGEVDGLEAGHVERRRRGEHGLPVRHLGGFWVVSARVSAKKTFFNFSVGKREWREGVEVL
ncbi:hypothetical protein CTA1_11173 [Colletotrichum tanaceti]|uniref:Uncharacterized protein n=1 Tax=Colletotrichum tanaceti TaxID=1306861 RepID=A0A4U6X1U4_9PEZI|nr:hypothetical protein CTA1_11173 [Colletotrichum tanaceti]